MPLSDPRSVFGVHSVTPFSRESGEAKGILRVLGGSTLSIEGELIKLVGGSLKFPWHIEEGLSTAELQLKVKEYPDFLFELFAGKAPTTNLAASESVSALENKTGTTVFSATIGIASLGVESGQEADVKFSHYVVKAVSPTTVDVFAYSDIDFLTGDDLVYQDDALKITSSPLTIVTTTAVSIPNSGLELTGGSGTIAMVVGDTAIFRSLPAGDETSVLIGATTDIFPEFGALVLAKKRGNNEMFEIELFRCKGSGLPIGFEENAWSEPEINVEAFYDAAKNAVFRMRTVKPS